MSAGSARIAPCLCAKGAAAAKTYPPHPKEGVRGQVPGRFQRQRLWPPEPPPPPPPPRNKAAKGKQIRYPRAAPFPPATPAARVPPRCARARGRPHGSPRFLPVTFLSIKLPQRSSRFAQQPSLRIKHPARRKTAGSDFGNCTLWLNPLRCGLEAPPFGLERKPRTPSVSTMRSGALRPAGAKAGAAIHHLRTHGFETRPPRHTSRRTGRSRPSPPPDRTRKRGFETRFPRQTNRRKPRTAPWLA